ncbi:hypothetical protein AWZ03_005235 [Drosophila navojoa]|uniref:Cytochrome P450 n=1 Tax=Drosophila navojoa TaxID=7232 RepID=A0A484BJQ6_DRONA|nr:hypothetical protein AWZ03_005235 [Drosophila navojoa]
MGLGLLLLIALGTLIFWLYRLNKEYYVLAFFAKRVKTKDGRPVEYIAPIADGRTIFGNSFDLIGRNEAEVFSDMRNRTKKMCRSYIEYAMGTSIFCIIDADNLEAVLNDQNLITKGMVYEFLQPALHTGLLTSTETAMGIKLDDMAAKGDRYRQSFSMIEKIFIRRFSNPIYWSDTLYELFGSMEDKRFLRDVHEFSSEIIAKRRILLAQEIKERGSSQEADDDIYINKKQRFAMLDTLIFAEKDGLIDHAGICEEVDTLMFEGFDTTSIGLIFGLMNMSLYQDKQELCYQEISEHIADDFSNLDLNQVSKLKYLECFVKETMRLFPSVPIMSRKTLKETELANGLILPPGAQIVMHIFDVHRNPKYWSSPEEFQPERFFPENSRDRHTYAYVPFSAGQRNCIGQKFALLEMKTLLIVILKKFIVLPLVDPKDIVFHTGITLRCKNDIRVKLVRRS